MIDIHCHILPGIDDGPGKMAQAVEMALSAQQSGTGRIIATPHFMNGVYAVGKTTVDASVRMFSKVLKKRNISVKIFPGAEIRIAHNTCTMIKKGLLPSLANSNYYLFELPEVFIKDGILNVMRQLMEQNDIPIIAHPERNCTLMKHPDLIKEFICDKVLFQVTGDSILGKNGRISKKIAKEMITLGQAHFIASDGHDTVFRKPSLKHVFSAVKRISNEKTAHKILIENPSMIMDQMLGDSHRVKRVG